MNVFFTSDTHFQHANIIKYCNRPFGSVEEMNSTIIENWNKMVKPNDTIYHLGDFCFSPSPEQFTKCLNGKKVLIRGNHDRWSRKAKETIKSGFSEIYDTLLLKHSEALIFLSHYSHRVWPNSHHGSIHLYGHSHGGLPPYGMSFDVGVDINGFKPMSFEEVVDKIKYFDIKYK